MRSVRYGSFLVALVVLWGCGGGSSGKTSDNHVKTSTIGQASFGFVGQPSATLTQSVGNLTVAGLGGAAFNYIDFYPAQTINNTQLAYIVNGQVWTYSFATKTATQITHVGGNGGYALSHPTWSPNGKIAVSGRFTGTQAAYTMLADGSGFAPISGSGVVVYRPSWSPDGLHIAGQDANGNFVVMNPNGTGVVQLEPFVNIDNSFNLCWFGNSSIVYSKPLSGFESIYKIPAGGGTPVKLANDANSGVYPVNPSCYPDSTAMIYQIPGPTPVLINVEVGFSTDQILTPSGYRDSFPAVGPDSLHLAFYRELDPPKTNDGISGIYTESVSGAGSQQLVADPTSPQLLTTASDLTWSPYLKYQRFIGSGGSLGSASAGFLFGQYKDAFTSFISISAADPSTLTITPAASNTSADGALVFTATANSISRFVYVNGYYGAATSVTPSGATNLLVSFSAATGQITTVAPLAIGFKAVASSTSKNDFSGKFSAIYDRKGKNLAPNGASSIHIDSKSGELTSWK